MNLNTIPMFGLLNRSMAWLTRNHQVLAENVANANTPMYQAKELKPLDFDRVMRATVRPVNIAQTQGRHFGGTLQPKGPFLTEKDGDPYEVTPSGNSVSLEEQSVRVAKNAMDYTLATTLYGKSLSMMKIALGRQR